MMPVPNRKKAVIAGATGVVGRNLLRHLLTLGDWDVIAVSRRKPDVEGRYEHVAVDLLDRAQTFGSPQASARRHACLLLRLYRAPNLGGNGRAEPDDAR